MNQHVKQKNSNKYIPDWKRIVDLLHLSREIDRLEVEELLPTQQMYYQFSAAGHDVSQLILGGQINHKHDAITGYYRSRPILLNFDVDLDDVIAASILKLGGYSDGRDIGHVFNHASEIGPSALPMAGGVGAQFTPAIGWAQSIVYYRETLGNKEYNEAIAVAHGGEASCATNGFWSALTIATTQNLPIIFYIEDNGYGISTTSDFQTPGENIAANLSSFKNLLILDGDGTDIEQTVELTNEAVTHARSGKGAVLLRLTVPRLSGHSAQDTQAYKSVETIDSENKRDPLKKLKTYLSKGMLDKNIWDQSQLDAKFLVANALKNAQSRNDLDVELLSKFVFSEKDENGEYIAAKMGGLSKLEKPSIDNNVVPDISGARINMVRAIRQTLDVELSLNPKMMIFGEDIGEKGGVHAVTAGLQKKHGRDRVFNTSLSEEGIIGRSVGMAIAGLLPVPEIQFRKYADPACEHLTDIGTLRWRTGNRFAAPMVVRMAGGFFKCGDPWHSQSNEVQFLHAIGWHLAMPSNAQDAVGLLRAALRGNDPVIFFEHRAMLDHVWARKPYPGDDYIIPFGKANLITRGDELTIVTWGAMVERCQAAVQKSEKNVDLIDLRTLSPWDKSAVLDSVKKTSRCIIVHEDNISAGFGAEISATIMSEIFMDLDAPVMRLTMPDIPSPHASFLLDVAVPSVDEITKKINEIIAF
uniref:2-oxoglutarate dehydrogenase E1 component n=1 Tax=OCS116 cluster bacterium TaxID=2030921 RepID=A0A2A4YYS3_9PROT